MTDSDKCPCWLSYIENQQIIILEYRIFFVYNKAKETPDELSAEKMGMKE